MATVIVKNNTASPVVIEDLGISLAATETKDLTTFFDFIDITESSSLKTLVSAATVTINDGLTDLGIDKGLEHLEIESVHLDYLQDAEDGQVAGVTTYSGVVTNTVTAITDSYVDTIYEGIEFQNNITVVEWTVAVPDTITIKESGTYRISSVYNVRSNTPATVDVYSRITINGVLTPSETSIRGYQTEINQMSLQVTVNLSAGDVVKSQIRTDTGSTADIMQARLNVAREEGIPGPAGPPGGSTVETQDEGTPIVVNTSTLNFIGNAVSVTDGGNNKANIVINDQSTVTKYVQLYDTVGLIQINTTLPTFLPWNAQDYRDTDTFDHSTVTNKSRVYVLVDGWYVLSYAVNFLGDNGVKNIAIYARSNGTLDIPRTTSYGNSFRNGDPYGSTTMSGVLIPLNAGDYMELGAYQAGSSGVAYTIANQSWLSLRYTRSL